MEDRDEKLKRYADIKQSIKSLNEEAAVINTEIVAQMAKDGDDQLETSFGTFTMAGRKNWAYPEYVSELEKTLKTKKKESEENGDASFEEKKYLKFNEVKPTEEE